MNGENLLNREDPASTYVDDAEHWVAVYSELLHTAQVAMESGPATDQGRQTYEHFDDRLRFWQHRLGQMRQGQMGGPTVAFPAG